VGLGGRWGGGGGGGGGRGTWEKGKEKQQNRESGNKKRNTKKKVQTQKNLLFPVKWLWGVGSREHVTRGGNKEKRTYTFLVQKNKKKVPLRWRRLSGYRGVGMEKIEREQKKNKRRHPR